MEGVSHVKIHIYLELRSFDEFMLNYRDWLLGNRDVFVDLSVITTETDERLGAMTKGEAIGERESV